MRAFLLIAPLFVTIGVTAQLKATRFYSKEVGWTLVFPKGFVYDSAFNIPDAKVDSTNGTMTIAGLTFDSYHVTVYQKGKVLFDDYLLSKFYKGYDFSIGYLYLEQSIKKAIEEALAHSTFTN